MSPPDSIEIVSRSEEETVRIGRAIAAAVEPATAITLEGELGSGKTRLTWGIAEGLGLDRRGVSRPPFAIVHEYPSPDGARLIHVAAYRVGATAADDFETLLSITPGLDDWVAVIEWPARIADLLPENRLAVRIGHAPGNARSIHIEAAGAVIARLRTAITEEPSDG